MAVASFEELRQKQKAPSFEDLRGAAPSFETLREKPEFEEMPLLTGRDVPEAYRRMGGTEWRPSSPSDPDYIKFQERQNLPGPQFGSLPKDVRPKPKSLGLAKAGGEILPGLARGTEQMIGTAGSAVQWAAEQAKFGDVLTKHIDIPGAGIIGPAGEHIIMAQQLAGMVDLQAA